MKSNHNCGYENKLLYCKVCDIEMWESFHSLMKDHCENINKLLKGLKK